MYFGKPSATAVFPKELNAMEPIEISDPLTSLEAAFVPRYSIEHLSAPWQRADLRGVYVLLSDLQFTSTFTVYVGATEQGYEQALQERNEHAGFWSHAILFANHNGVNLTSEQTRGLDGRLKELFSCGRHIQVLHDDLSESVATAELNGTDIQFVDLMALFVVRVMFLKNYRSASLAKAVRPLELAAARYGEPA